MKNNPHLDERWSRRRFLHSLTLGATGLMLAPSLLLGGCSGDDEEDKPAPGPSTPVDPAKVGSVAIIGAGAAGLQAALDLRARGVEVKVYEAANTWGGRVRSLTRWADFPVELGAEEVHGVNSILGRYVREAGARYVDIEGTDYIFLPPLLRSEEQAATVREFAQAQALFEELEDLDEWGGADQSMFDLVRGRGMADITLPWLNAVLANEYGTSLRRIGIKARVDADANRVDPGADALLADQSMQQVLQRKFESVLPLVQGNTPIVNVRLAEDGSVELRDRQGRVFNHRRVIVTAPLAVLKANKINFEPGLPEGIRNAIARLGMDPGMKVILKFRRGFWQPNTGSIYGAGPIPEYWATAVGRGREDRYLTAFVHGELAESLIAAGESAGVQRILQDLDTMFGPGKATDNLEAHIWMDWSAEEWIGGAYSYPSVGSSGVAMAFEQPVRDSLFFAGEHTHNGGYYATVHGAIESGQRVARQVLDTGR